ncbi:DNA cytosine methyltransferase [Streptomyces ipomoeae]|uniref:DNA (cytosine-5-)-methyltransferase n=1 Tax=Streptomyces ipomoeae TaxID=103232 RepID=A0AAE8W1P7_9ACTN|nr:DNA cytosine methyltransferase [Streptomyces ipomoeae]
MTWKVVDLFAGAGGSSSGLVEAGFELLLAANHSHVCMLTHAANHPNAEHLCVDINNYDMRRLPKADVLWASPICTEISPAGGRRRIPKGQQALLEFGPIDKGTFDRTRATAFDVIRYLEVHRPLAAIIENVVEFVTDWEMFDWWFDGLRRLGYNPQISSASSAHLGGEDNAPAPQWRDRVYIVCTLKGIPVPDVRPNPLALCTECGEDVHAVQSWRNGKTVGKYRVQYDYRCPNERCGHALVEPYVRPARDIIDWSNLGPKIGERKKPLAERTMEKVRKGREMYPHEATAITLTHGDHEGRVFPVSAQPLPTRTSKVGEGLLVPVGGSWNDTASPVGVPMRTRTTRESEALVTMPFIVELRGRYVT